ncbi:MAG: hypothetical protein J0I99_00550 [Devosia sp.]|uniref:hypothetical protein n=1 Tax=Devosia sp. TaxID=1871048 RepID=UPI001ACACE9E|nr:hypothetical protein [Devosia sp.]MBN9314206.1 hypothetical protein [Devosia sp.]
MWFKLSDAEQSLVQHHLRSAIADQGPDPKAITLADRLTSDAKPETEDAQAYRDAADDPFGEVNVDEDAPVTVSASGGAWVLAWVYVSDADAGIEEDEEGEDD